MGSIHLFSHGAEHTTARYFEHVLQADDSLQYIYWDHCPDISQFDQDDMFFFIDPAPDWPLGLEKARCITVAYLIDAHQNLAERLRMANFFDVVFVAQKDYVDKFNKAGHPNAHWLPLACDPGIHEMHMNNRPFQVGFVGKLGLRGSWRYETLMAVLPRFRTNDFRHFYNPHDMAKVYNQSKIVFNASIGGDLNMRFFEGLASGALLITDRIDNGLSELFEEDVHYVGYSSAEEGIEKINYYLSNDIDRLRIAAAGQKTAFERHTYGHRWDQVFKLSVLASREAPVRNDSRHELSALYSDIFVALRMPGAILRTISRYGLTQASVLNLIKSYGRKLNARVPLTPNAIRYSLRNK